MKKLHYFLSAVILAGCLTSCSHDNDGPNTGHGNTTTGFYIINNGNMGASIASSVTAYDYSTGVSTPALQDAFLAANGIPLGEGAQPALIYGSKMYIPMHDSNLIWVVRAHNLEIIDMIRPEGQAQSPRYLVSHKGKVYASMNSGYVCCIDTLTLKIEKSMQTGPNPDQMTVADGKLYVANSDGYNWDELNPYANGSISIIDLVTWQESKIKDISKVLNPTDLATNGKDVFVICKGNYGNVPSMVKKIVGNDVVDVAEGQYMAVHKNRLYVINAPYGIDRNDMTFTSYNTSSLKAEGDFVQQSPESKSWIESPCGVSIDPVSGEIVVLSYTTSEAGYTQYKEPCYANIYSPSGVFSKRVECGVGAVGITFIYSTSDK